MSAATDTVHGGVVHRAVTRPAIPLSFWIAGAMWLGVCVAEGALWRGRIDPARPVFWLVVGVAMLAAATCALRTQGWCRVTALILAGFILGGVLGSLYWADVRVAGTRLEASKWGEWSGRVMDDARPAGERWVVTIALDAGEGASRSQVEVVWPSGEDVPDAGRSVTFATRFAVPDRSDPWARSMWRSGTAAQGRAVRGEIGSWSGSVTGRLGPVRVWCRERLAVIGGDGGALLEGVLIGSRDRLRGTAAEEAFRLSGVAHLLAVSGTHLAVLAAIVWLLARRAHLPLPAQVGCVLMLAVAYLGISGCRASTLRAFVMLAAAGGAMVSGRRGDPLSAIPIACMGMFAISPAAAFDFGFALSVSAVVGLVLLGTLATAWARTSLPRPLSKLAPALAASVVAQVVTMPLTVPAFNTVPLVGPVTNLVAVPLVTLCMAVGLAGLGAGLLVESLGMWILTAAGMGMSAVARYSAWCAAVPGSVIFATGSTAVWSAVVVTAMVATWVWWPQPRSGSRARIASFVGAATLVIVVVMPGSRSPSIMVLDVGQGDAILVRSGGCAVLVDAGPSDAALASALARQSLRRLDALVLTHAHDDHTGGVSGLLGVMRPSVSYIAGTFDGGAGMASEQMDLVALYDRTVPVEVLEAGDVITCGDWKLSVLWPPVGHKAPDENAGSIVLLAETATCRVLLTGDAEADVLHEIMQERSGLQVDVLKVGHHGSADSVTVEQLRTMAVRSAIISVGTGNTHGHPDPDTLATLQEGLLAPIRTDLSGDVEIRVTKTGFELITHGGADVACERITSDPAISSEDHVQADRPQERLPDLWQGGSPAAGCCRTAQRESLGGRGSGLQPLQVRWGEGGCQRDCGGVQHDAIHVRAPPCDRLADRQDANFGPGRIG